MDDRVQQIPSELKTIRFKQKKQEITDLVYVGGGRFIRFRFQRKMNPYLVLLNSLHLISAIIAIAIMILLNVWLGVIILLLMTALFNYLRTLVHPKFVRGWSLGEEAVVFPRTEGEYPPLSESSKLTPDDEHPKSPYERD